MQVPLARSSASKVVISNSLAAKYYEFLGESAAKFEISGNWPMLRTHTHTA